MRDDIRYRLEILPDRPPGEIVLRGATSEEMQLGIDQTLELGVESRDPDYGLREVHFYLSLAGQQRCRRRSCCGGPVPSYLTRAGFEQLFASLPTELALRPDDRLTAWAVAADNREPEANWSESARFAIQVISPEEQLDGTFGHPFGRR